MGLLVCAIYTKQKLDFSLSSCYQFILKWYTEGNSISFQFLETYMYLEPNEVATHTHTHTIYIFQHKVTLCVARLYW